MRTHAKFQHSRANGVDLYKAISYTLTYKNGAFKYIFRVSTLNRGVRLIEVGISLGKRVPRSGGAIPKLTQLQFT